MMQATIWGIKKKFPDVPNISTAEFGTLLKEKPGTSVKVMDCRAPEEYQISRIPGAERVDPSTEKEELKSLLDSSKSAEVLVCYCSVGYRSSSVAQKLMALGIIRELRQILKHHLSKFWSKKEFVQILWIDKEVRGIMPWLRGEMPIRRTFYHLQQGKILLRNQVKVLSLGYSNALPNHEGVREFVYWHWAQLQYKNMHVQLVKYEDYCPTPFCQVFLDDGREVLVDLDRHTRQEVHDRIGRVFGKTELVLRREALQSATIHNPANFGKDCGRHCMCEVPGQFTCPGMLDIPKYMKGSWRWNKNLI